DVALFVVVEAAANLQLARFTGGDFDDLGRGQAGAGVGAATGEHLGRRHRLDADAAGAATDLRRVDGDAGGGRKRVARAADVAGVGRRRGRRRLRLHTRNRRRLVGAECRRGFVAAGPG